MEPSEHKVTLSDLRQHLLSSSSGTGTNTSNSNNTGKAVPSNMSLIAETSEEDDDTAERNENERQVVDMDIECGADTIRDELGSDSQKLLEREHQQRHDLHEQMMIKYWRSKSLPVAYFPPPHHFILIQQQQQQENEPASPTTTNEHRPLEFLASTSSGGTSGQTQSSNSNNMQIQKNGNNNLSNSLKGRDLKANSTRVNGTSNEQELNPEAKKKSDWRTLQQHYYPEGGWGWVVTFCAVISQALCLGIQLYLSTVVAQRFNRVAATVGQLQCHSDSICIFATGAAQDAFMKIEPIFVKASRSAPVHVMSSAPEPDHVMSSEFALNTQIIPLQGRPVEPE